MKKVLFSSVILSFLLLIGCQDNSITNPVSSQPLNKSNINQAEIAQRIIPLDYKLMDPVRGDIEYRLSGNIDYSDELIKPGPSETVLEKDVKLDNSVMAYLTIISPSDIKVKTWKISSESDDLVKFISDNRVVLVKSYPVKGMKDITDLVCTFVVSTKGEELKSVNLETPEVNANVGS